ncbi:unnamed protein product, partial [Sphagnum balticum]
RQRQSGQEHRQESGGSSLGVDEINFFRDDNTILHFKQPEDPNTPTAAGATECTCYQGLFWNTDNDPPTCDPCDGATEGDCGIGSPSCFNFYWDEIENCTACESAPETDCGLLASCIDYYYDNDTGLSATNCELITDSSGCGLGTSCPDAYFDSNTDQCTNCDSLTDPAPAGQAPNVPMRTTTRLSPTASTATRWPTRVAAESVRYVPMLLQ